MNNTIYLEMPSGEHFKVVFQADRQADVDSLLDELNKSGATYIKEADYSAPLDPMVIEFTSEQDPKRTIAVMTTKNIYNH